MDAFDIAGISKSPAIFDIEKLTYFNALYPASSMFRETSASVLDFLLVKRETSYSGKASKKSTFSGSE